MDSARWQRVQELFARALETPEAERAAFLEKEAGADPEVRAEVRSLLDADTDGHSLLDRGAADAADRLGMLDDASAVGDQVGPWRLTERIGQGGMGSVYLAERADGEFEQKVALKIIKRGMDSEEIIRRFRGERQILARLDHPNIARFLDGGLTDKDVPWFTMEYVDGVPIDEYCDLNALTVDQRLDLFSSVCGAVAYAQRNLVVHRDLKPSNILVTRDGVPKLLDFGIAKLLDPGGGTLGEAPAALTRTGHRIMTPGYAAPEQVRGELVTTATDVYALGVVLYELLTGQRPYAPEDESAEALERAICESAPQRPSTVVVRPGPAARPATGDTTEPEAAGSSRGTRPGQLSRRLAGDLDNICLMALRKEPERRYDSAGQLLEDVERFRGGRPVVARPDTAMYRLQKFVRRNRAGVATAAVVLGIVIGLVSFYTARLTEERDRARLEAEKSRSVSTFLAGLFETADPSESLGEDITARELLDRGAARIESELADQPEVRATMLDVVGNVYLNLGLYPDADSLLTRSHAERERLFPGDHEDRAGSLIHLGDLRRAQGLYEEAEQLTRRALDMEERLHGPDTGPTARPMYQLAWILNEVARFEDAEPLFRRAIAAADLPGGAPRLKLSAKNSLALLLNETGRNLESEALYAEVLAEQRAALGDMHPELATTLYNYSQVLRMNDKFKESEAAIREATAIDRHVFGDTHPNVAYDLISLGRLKKKYYEMEEADRLFREAYEIRRAFHPGDHPEIAYSLNDMAQMRQQLGDWGAADSLYRASLEMHKRLNGEEHPVVTDRYRDLGRMAYSRGRYDEAVEWLRLCHDVRARIWGTDHRRYGEACLYYAKALSRAGNPALAESLLARATEIAVENDGPGGRAYRFQRHGHAIVRWDQGRTEEAEEMFREVIALRAEAYGEDHPLVAATEMDLAAMMMEDPDRTQETADLMRRVLAIRSEALPENGLPLAWTRAACGIALARVGADDEARALLDQGLPLLRERLGPDHARVKLAEETRAGL